MTAPAGRMGRMTLAQGKARLQRLAQQITDAVPRELQAPDVVELQQLMGHCRLIAMDLLGLKPALQDLYDEAARMEEMVRGTAARYLRTKLPASSPLLSSLPKLATEVFGPDGGNDFGVSQLVDLPRFYDTTNDEMFRECFFAGGPTPEAAAEQSFSARTMEAKRLLEHLTDLSRHVNSIREEIPTQYGMARMINEMEQATEEDAQR